jgi:hypothetical protein
MTRFNQELVCTEGLSLIVPKNFNATSPFKIHVFFLK